MDCFIHRVYEHATGRSIQASVNYAGQDIVIVVTGGSRPHVGSVVFAQPTDQGRGAVSCSVLTIPPHKEEAVARPIAEAVCKTSAQVTVVTAGIHEDRLDTEGVRIYLDLAEKMAAELAERLRR